ncbi:hypothetical protein GCM10009675_48380 [Prauserella alba]|uniref:Uncharacterized protein n=1 Tax=Prauserella alba TaxID=176898 RepID=A0ABP4GBZ3_9PSEU
MPDRPCQDLHQRRLSRAVVADEAEYLAGAQPEVDPAQRLHRAERLRDALERDERVAAPSITAPSITAPPINDLPVTDLRAAALVTHPRSR